MIENGPIPSSAMNGSNNMNMFDSFRGENGFTFYPNHESPNSIDKPLVIVTYFCALVALATLLATCGVRGKEKWYCALRASYSVAVGSIILVCLVSHSWKEGSAKVISSPYVYRTDLQFQGVVGLKIGLHSANITLEGTYHGSDGKLQRVSYVESLLWTDFGAERDSYKPALQRGLPEPILRVMDFLTINDGGMRWGPAFHSAGQVTCAILWTAFAFWILTNVLLFSVVVYGAYFFFFTGFAMLMACVAFDACQNDFALYMIYEDAILELSYGWSFWLTLVTGICTTSLGVVLIAMDHFLPDVIAEFFILEKPVTEELSDDCITAPKQAIFATTNRMANMLAPPHSGERRGSIFMEPERRRYSNSESIFNRGSTSSSLETSLPPFVNKAFEGDNNTKFNPLFIGDEMINLTEEDRKLAEMEKVCERGPFHLKDHKASLATLNELRDNHANERRSNSFSNIREPSAKSNKVNSGTNSLQSSPNPLRFTPLPPRPRSGSDGLTLTGPSLNQYRPSSVVINVDSCDSNKGMQSNDFEDEMNMCNTLKTSEATKENIISNQVEVEVETHHSSASDIEDVLPPPLSLPSDDGDDSDKQSSNSVCEYEVTPVKKTNETTDKDKSGNGNPSQLHSEPQQISIEIEKC